MAKQSGLAWTTCSVDSSAGTPEAIKNDVTDLDFKVTRGVQETTGIDKSATERLLLLADFSVTLNGVANFASSPSEHDVFNDIGTGTALRTVTLTIGGKTLANECLFTSHAYKRGDDGKLTWSAEGVLADGTIPAWA
jgi:hypothetical protein